MNDFYEQLKTADGREWLSMQYVLQELSDDQMLAFEDAMLADESLAEFVIASTRMVSGIALAFESKPSVAPQHSETLKYSETLKPTAWRSVTIAVGAVLAGALLMTLRPVDEHRSEVASVDEIEMADAFASLLPDEIPSLGQAESFDDVLSEDTVTSLVAPEWLLTAVDLDNGVDDEQNSSDSDVY